MRKQLLYCVGKSIASGFSVQHIHTPHTTCFVTLGSHCLKLCEVRAQGTATSERTLLRPPEWFCMDTTLACTRASQAATLRLSLQSSCSFSAQVEQKALGLYESIDSLPSAKHSQCGSFHLNAP